MGEHQSPAGDLFSDVFGRYFPAFASEQLHNYSGFKEIRKAFKKEVPTEPLRISSCSLFLSHIKPPQASLHIPTCRPAQRHPEVGAHPREAVA